MSFPRAYQNTTLLPDGTVLVTGGGSHLDGLNVKVQSILYARCEKCHEGGEGQGKADLSTYEALE